MPHIIAITFSRTAEIHFSGISSTYKTGIIQVITEWTQRPPDSSGIRAVQVKGKMFKIAYSYPHEGDPKKLKVTGILYPQFRKGDVHETFEGDVFRYEDDDDGTFDIG